MALTHLLIGAGNMGGALLSAWLDNGLVSPRNVAILDPKPGGRAVFAIERGALHLDGPEAVPKSIQTVLLAIKPQQFRDIAPALAESLPVGSTVISVLAGTTLSALRTALPAQNIVRAMPNTPASIGEGMTAYITAPDADGEVIDRADTLLGACGRVLRLETDDQLNAVTAISGSGPAYVFHLCEALAASAKAVGLDEEQAEVLARQTIIGAAGLLSGSDRSPSELRQAVTSPGGTTQAALEVLMDADGMADLMRRAVRAAYARARELSD